MIALAYLATVAAGLVVLAVALRHRPAPPPPPPPPPPPLPPLPPAPVPAAEVVDPGTEIRVILAAATQLATRLSTAA